MPLYEYECETCGRRFERIQKFSDPPVAACPTCTGPVKKLFSSPAIQFKGSGFYITDYAKSGSKGTESTEAGGGKGTPNSATSAESSKSDTSSSSSNSTESSTPSSKPEPSKAPTGSGSKD